MRAAASCLLLAGCIITSDDTTAELGAIDATWSFRTAAGDVLDCPEDFGIVEITAQPVTGGKPVIDVHPCDAFSGTATYPLDAYDVTIAVTSNGGNVEYARSRVHRVDIVLADARVREDFIHDGGRIELAWTADCTQVAMVELLVHGLPDRFACGDGTGISRPLPANTYEARVTALDAGGAPLGEVQQHTVELGARNDYQDLGTLTLAVD